MAFTKSHMQSQYLKPHNIYTTFQLCGMDEWLTCSGSWTEAQHRRTRLARE